MAGGGLRGIQADVDLWVRYHDHHPTPHAPQDGVAMGRDPAEVQDLFHACEWVFRAREGQVHVLRRQGSQFYPVDHPSFAKMVSVGKRSKTEAVSSLMVHFLTEGDGQKTLTVGLESDHEIVIEEGLQLKRLVMVSPKMILRAMAVLDLSSGLEGVDVDTLDLHGTCYLEGDSTLQVRDLHLHTGPFHNQGTLVFKDDATAHLYGHPLLNEATIQGRTALRFKGGLFHQRTSYAHLSMPEGSFFYEGPQLLFHPTSRIEASKITLISDQKVALPLVRGEKLHLKAPEIDEESLKNARSFKKLKIISTVSPLIFTTPHVFLGSVTAQAQSIRNAGGLYSQGSLHLTGTTILNEASLGSEGQKVILDGEVQHLSGQIGALKGVEIKGITHTLFGEFHPHTPLLIQSQQGFTYDPAKLTTQNLLKLIFQEPMIFSQELKTAGSLSFLFHQGGTLETPLEVKGSLEIEALPGDQGVNLKSSLKVGGSLRIKAPGHKIQVGDALLPFLEIQTGGLFNVTAAHTFDLIKGGLFADQGLHISTQEAIFLGRWQESLKTHQIQRSIGPERTLTFPYLTGNGSYLASNKGLTLDARTCEAKGSEMVVTTGDLSLIFSTQCSLHSTLIEVWKGDAFLKTNHFYQDMMVVQGEGEKLLPPYWIKYLLPQSASPRLMVNGDLRVESQKAENKGGTLLCSGKIEGTELIVNHDYPFFLDSAIPHIFDHPHFRKTNITMEEKLNLFISEKFFREVTNQPRYWLVPYSPTLLLQTHVKEAMMAQIEGSQGVIFTHAYPTVLQGQIKGDTIALSFEGSLTLQSVTSVPLRPFESFVDLSLFNPSTSLMAVDPQKTSPSLLSPSLPLKYPLEARLEEIPRLVVGPLGSATLRPLFSPLLEGRALMQALPSALGYLPLDGEDLLSFHYHLRHTGAEVMRVLRPLLESSALSSS